jgi:mRNA interferase MazF
MREIKRWEIYSADLTPVQGCEQGGENRPVLILQNDIGNKYSPTTIVCAITAQENKNTIPTHISLGEDVGLSRPSTALLEQVRTVDKKRLKKRLGDVSNPIVLQEVEKALKVSFGMLTMKCKKTADNICKLEIIDD